jgi:hypothetical protein
MEVEAEGADPEAAESAGMVAVAAAQILTEQMD